MYAIVPVIHLAANSKRRDEKKLVAMTKHYITALALIFSTTIFSQTPYVSKVWKADNGDGTYTNPILHADYSDPDAIRVGNDYYLTASSFEDVPGLPILHSKDMVNWKIITYALKR